jgi:hypothetical protein
MAMSPREIPSPNELNNNQHPTPSVPNKIPTPRVKPPLLTITKAIVDKPIPNVLIKLKSHKAREEPLVEQTRLRQEINESKNSRAQITQQTHILIQQQEYSECAQLVWNNKMGQYLNYRQLIREPKHKEIWSTSAANKFKCLTQRIGGRVKGTNTIFFICKDQVSKDRIKYMTYGSYGCEIKQNKEEKHCT